jgi:hypothetical protein
VDAVAAVGRYRAMRFDYRQVLLGRPTMQEAVFSALL